MVISSCHSRSAITDLSGSLSGASTGASTVVPFHPFLEEGSPTNIDYRKKGTLIPTSLLEDLAEIKCPLQYLYLRHSRIPVALPTNMARVGGDLGGTTCQVLRSDLSLEVGPSGAGSSGSTKAGRSRSPMGRPVSMNAKKMLVEAFSSTQL